MEVRIFFTECRNNCVCLVCHETVSVCKDYNADTETKHASTFDKLSEADRAEKVEQPEDSLATQQLYFKQAGKSNESITKASFEVALLIAKHSTPFSEDKFVKIVSQKWQNTFDPKRRRTSQTFPSLGILWQGESKSCRQILKDNWKRGH